MKNSFLLSMAFVATIFYGCAFDLVHIDQVPVQYVQTGVNKTSFELKDEVNINLPTGYSSKLNKGTQWHYIDTITHGDIFKTKDQILTIEGSNIFEAYIVVSQKQLVGFFLPVEGTFSPLSTPITLAMENITQ